MSATLRLVFTALIGLLVAGCLIPVPVPGPGWGHGDRDYDDGWHDGGHRHHDRGRHGH